MSQKTQPVEQDIVSEAPTADEITTKVRSLVGSLLDGGAAASDVTFALVYIATELGLVVSEDPLRVFPVVLSAVSRAAADCGDHAVSAEADNPKEERPEGETVH